MSDAAALPRLLAGPAGAGPGTVDLDGHLALHGLPALDRDAAAGLADAADRAGLHGRGGAAFPTARKLRALAGARGPLRLRSLAVVANGAEAEPASRKDRVLLARSPHLVLDGLQLAALALGAQRAWIAVPEGAAAVRAAIDVALAERARAGRDAVAVAVATVPPRFVAGEERSLVHALNGGPPIPTAARPWQRGVDGSPTLVQNVETLAHLALIAARGPEWFRAVGDPGEPGSALVTVTGAIPGVDDAAVGAPTGEPPVLGVGDAAVGRPLREPASGPLGTPRPDVREVPVGTPLRNLVAGPFQALLAGGYAGGWLSPAAAAGARLLRADLVPLGATTGCGALVALPQWACPVAETARLARWLAGESAGQCGPCVFGLDAIAAALQSLRGPRPPRRDPLPDLRRWCGEVAGRGACGHPDGGVRMVRSALRVFAAELDDHARRGARDRCSAEPFLPLPAVLPPLPLRTARPRGAAREGPLRAARPRDGERGPITRSAA